MDEAAKAAAARKMPRFDRVKTQGRAACQQQHSGHSCQHSRGKAVQARHDQRLYALETRILSRSVRLPALLAPVRERIAQSLHGIMNDTAKRLAAELAGVVYRR
ncbi:MAG: hypothetical protein K2Y16_05515 [Burkholderiales bacterium]|nr:hypothetical protein [Burkholderiales bacterium]